MNPARKGNLIKEISEIANVEELPEFVSKLSYTQLQELRDLLQKAYERGQEAGVEYDPFPVAKTDDEDY